MVQLNTVDKHVYVEKHDVHCHCISCLSCVNYFGRDMVLTLCTTTYTATNILQ